MDTSFKLKLPALFAAACLLKIVCLVASYLLGELIITGFAVPMIIMFGYVILGYKYRNSDVSDEKFADSCYYLGFIFTIASIIVSLIDLPNIQGDMLAIATRFGVAMISTIVGLSVRVVLVSFRPNMEDALRNNEQSAVEASRRLTDEYARAFHALVHFRGEVMAVTTEAVKTVRDSFEEVAKENAERMNVHFADLTAQNKTHFEELSGRINYAFIENIKDLKTSSLGLQKIIEKHTHETDASLAQINQNVSDFTGALIARLDSVAFPDDLFSQKLSTPISQLNSSADEASSGIKSVSRDVTAAARAVERSITKINVQSENLSDVLHAATTIAQDQARLIELVSSMHEMALKQAKHHDESIAKLSDQQHSVSDRLDTQITNLNVMSKSASGMTDAVGKLVEQVSLGQQSTASIVLATERTHADQQSLLTALKVTMESVPMLVKESREQSSAVIDQMRQLRQDSIDSNRGLLAVLERDRPANAPTQLLGEGGQPVHHEQIVSEMAADALDAARASVTSVNRPIVDMTGALS